MARVHVGMVGLNKATVRAYAPWHSARKYAHSPKVDHKGREDRAHYRGWTLVERINARYAAKGARYVRVCGLVSELNDVFAAFRAKVDELEDGGAAC